MSSLQAKTSAISIATGGQGETYSVLGFGSIGIAVAGTFTSGTMTFQGSNDGNTWTDLQVLQASTPVTSNHIVTTGNYVCGVVSYQLVRLFCVSFVGQVVVTSSLSSQIVLPVVEGGNIVVDSLTITGLEGALAADHNGLVYAVEGVSGDVMRQSGTGSGELDAVVWTGTRYVTVGASGAIYTSLNSTTWVQRTSTSGNQWFGLCWNGTNLLVAVGLGGQIATSPDGITWTAQTSGVATNLTSVTWDGTSFIAVGSSQVVRTSPDGITWTGRTFGTTVNIRGVASTSSLAIAVCASGTIKTSTDHGVTWTSRTSGVATTLWKVAVNAGGTLWTAVGDSGVILTSPDGTTWTPRTSGVATTLENVAFGNSLWIAVGDGGVILTSPDGTTWTTATSGTVSSLFGLVYGATWVVVGNAIKLTSPDAITWTPVSQNIWIASTPTGSGALVTAAGASTFTELRTFTTPIRESTILSAPAIATGASGDHVAATTTGTGSTLMLSASPSTTGTLTAAAANFSGRVGLGGNSITAVAVNNVGVANTSGTVQVGFNGGWSPSTGATARVSQIEAQLILPAGMTAAAGAAVIIDAPSIGAGSSATEMAGLKIGNQGAGYSILTGTGAALIGDTLTATSVTTGAPTTGTAAPWKLGSVVNAVSALDTSRYLEVEINGVFVKLAIIT